MSESQQPVTTEPQRSDLERTEELFAFLQGKIPDGYHIRRNGIPKLTAEQAWIVIWFLGNQCWQVPDHIERCDVCGELFDRESEGDVLDYGKAPTFFCEPCMDGPEHANKVTAKARLSSKTPTPRSTAAPKGMNHDQ